MEFVNVVITDIMGEHMHARYVVASVNPQSVIFPRSRHAFVSNIMPAWYLIFLPYYYI